MQYPLIFRLGQKLHGTRIDDVPAAVEAELAKLRLGSKIKPGDTVAITCGSRRIANYPAIIKAIVGHFKRLRANPFLVPAMGSHGSGTAECQRELLHGLGITEEIVGAEFGPRWKPGSSAGRRKECPSIVTRKPWTPITQSL